MALNDTFIKNNTKYSGKAAGDKHTDAGGMYLLVNAGGKYWRMDNSYLGKRKTLALGVYSDVSLAKVTASANTFEAVAAKWLLAKAAKRAAITQDKVTDWLRKDINPYIGTMPITTIGPRDVLAVARRMETRKVFDSAKRLVQICGQVFRFAVSEGTAERDITVELRTAA